MITEREAAEIVGALIALLGRKVGLEKMREVIFEIAESDEMWRLFHTMTSEQFVQDQVERAVVAAATEDNTKPPGQA